MAVRRAILAGEGALPGLLAEAGEALVVRLQGARPDLPETCETLDAGVETLGALYDVLRARGVTQLCLAGALSRGRLSRIGGEVDAGGRRFVEALAALGPGGGDDRALRMVIGLLEDEGFEVVGAHDIRPDLLASDGPIAGCPDAAQRAAAGRARAVLDTLGAVDVGQGAVASSQGVLGIETMQGTDAMLDFVARTAPGSRGVLVKRPKPGQELRADMPAIGPDTVQRAAEAGLSGICVAAGGTLVLGRASVVEAAEAHGLTLWAEA